MLELSAQTHDAETSADADAAPLVILHGLFGSASNWRSVAQKLSPQRTVYTLDQRNHGASPHCDSMGYQEMAADVVRFLDDRQLSRALVMGHSMGGKTAMHLALHQGHRVQGLIVVDIAPVPNRHDFASLIQAMRAVPVETIQRRADAEQALEASVPDQQLRQFLVQNLVRSEASYRWRINLNAIEANMGSILGFSLLEDRQPYRGPTLFLRGALSNYVRPEHHSAISTLFPSAETRSIADAGHWLHAEQPAAFLEQVQAFLNRSVAS